MANIKVILCVDGDRVQSLLIDDDFFRREEPTVTTKVESHYTDKGKYGTPLYDTCQEEIYSMRNVYKKCMRCKVYKPHTCFGFNTCGTAAFKFKSPHYRRGDCVTCSKSTRNDAGKARLRCDSKKPEKGTPCEICGKNSSPLVWDHDHETLLTRGWLCQSCNKGLGLLGDSVEGLKRALAYLNK